jgi:hypothetical protein
VKTLILNDYEYDDTGLIILDWIYSNELTTEMLKKEYKNKGKKLCYSDHSQIYLPHNLYEKLLKKKMI